jgi:hypothetical protein
MKTVAQTAFLPLVLFFIALAAITSHFSPASPRAPGAESGWDGGRSLEPQPFAPAPVIAAGAEATQDEIIEEGARTPASLPSPVAEFVSLRQKALPTAEESARLKKLLRDRGALQSAFDRLGDFDE